MIPIGAATNILSAALSGVNMNANGKIGFDFKEATASFVSSMIGAGTSSLLTADQKKKLLAEVSKKVTSMIGSYTDYYYEYWGRDNKGNLKLLPIFGEEPFDPSKYEAELDSLVGTTFMSRQIQITAPIKSMSILG
jgi:hypothetical protein